MSRIFRKSLFWFRRDLRIADNAALYQALRQSEQVYCVFVFDRDILDGLREEGITDDRRVEFILESVVELDAALREHEGGLIVRHAAAWKDIPALAAALEVDAVFANRDYEPQAIARDALAAKALQAAGRGFQLYKDQVVFEKDEILTQAGQPFSVFTPYKNAWMRKIVGDGGEFYLQAYPVERYLERLAPPPAQLAGGMPSLEILGFGKSNLSDLGIATGMSGAQALLDDFVERMGRYDTARDYPAVKGPSYLSVHLRFGTVSIRALARLAFDRMRGAPDMHDGAHGKGAAVWLSELIWRDFYSMILQHHPRVAGHAFKPAYDAIVWESGTRAEQLFGAWCDGRTGYPLIDAAMRQLNLTGYMHNRLRMVTASFLIKDLGIDWRWGERYFADQLNDFDLASNNGGWQWAASSGCDAQPYFRIFNPVAQSEKFDGAGKFIRRYLPQLAKLPDRRIHAPWTAGAEELSQAGVSLGGNYPQPVVQHDLARLRTLERYAVVKKAEAGIHSDVNPRSPAAPSDD
ncbi:deoxyribodipyrimidine photo-lyase [Oxalobacteraceae bacterium CAVE-383]|nr:deoxyribodipyrimidine photo-lyase [Oxalobacteraceae bacterium CAVE-383]